MAIAEWKGRRVVVPKEMDVLSILDRRIRAHLHVGPILQPACMSLACVLLVWLIRGCIVGGSMVYVFSSHAWAWVHANLNSLHDPSCCLFAARPVRL
jgi:hypothetical protein